MYDICCIGHITRDLIITPQSQVHLPGGTSYYFACGINALNHSPHHLSFHLITSLAEKDYGIVEELKEEGIDAEYIPNKDTVCFENIYNHDMNNRQQRVLATADPFRLEDLQHIKARYVVLGSLLAEDFDIRIFRYFHKSSILVVDAQGFLRSIKDNRVYASDWAWKREALKFVDILKVNQSEAEMLTGETDCRKTCITIARWGVREVLLTLGDRGCMLFHDGTFYEIAALQPREIVDATGCGDSFVMGYIFQRAFGASVLQAGRFATAISTIKLEHHGPFRDTYEEAIKRMSGQ